MSPLAYAWAICRSCGIFPRIGIPASLAIVGDPGITQTVLVDNHPKGNTDLPDRIDRQLQVVEPKGGWFGNQYHGIAIADSPYHGTAGSGRGIQQDSPSLGGLLIVLYRTDKWHRQGFSHIEQSFDQPDRSRLANGYRADFVGNFGYGLLRAEYRTATARMAEVLEYQGFARNHCDRIEFAHVRAYPASVACVPIDLGNHDRIAVPGYQPTGEKQVAVGLLDIAIEYYKRMHMGTGQVDRNKGLPCPALARGYRYLHTQWPSTSASRIGFSALDLYMDTASPTVLASA